MFIVKDSGNPSMSGTSTLTVIIGDENDNKMQPGQKEIMVYNYMVSNELNIITVGMVCGRISGLDAWPDTLCLISGKILEPDFPDIKFIPKYERKKKYFALLNFLDYSVKSIQNIFLIVLDPI